MNTYGLIGYPLGHSFSRKFFTEKFAKEGIDAQYLNFEIPSIEEFPNIIKNNPTLKGLNVTIPYKQQVMQYLDDISEEAKAHHDEWLKSINAESTELKTLDKYYDAKYSNSPEYQLLMGYKTAVEKGDISPLIGFDLYKQTSEEITAKIVGQTTADGIEVKDFTTHFIDRVLGQTSTPHDGMRLAVPVEKALDTVLNGIPGKIRVNNRGQTSQQLIGKDSIVTINPDTGVLIQTNPKG